MEDFYDPYRETDRRKHLLPHWQQGMTWIFVTWRLADSLPASKLREWKSERLAWLSHHPQPWDAATEQDYHQRFSQQLDDWLDQGAGVCLLRDPGNASIVAEALRHFDGSRYELASFVVMPNHVHVLFRPLGSYTLAQVMKSWKGFTARAINQRSGRQGSLWQDEYWDRMIRHQQHFQKVMNYIRRNPEKAGLGKGQHVLEITRERPWAVE